MFAPSELVQQAAHLANRLKAAGVGRGSKVLVALPNCPAFLLLLLAVNECGAVFMPVSPGLAPDERARDRRDRASRRRDHRQRRGRAAAGNVSLPDQLDALRR